MKKLAAAFFIVFSILVLADWAATGFGYLDMRQSNGLASVDFAFFSKKIQKNYISQGYGGTYFSLFNYPDRRHNGIDIVAKYGAPVLSASAGEIIATGDQDRHCYKRGFGKFVAVKAAGNGLVAFYAHLGEIKAKIGAEIKRGDIVGTIGASGLETAPHLHFSIFDVDGFTIKNKNGCGPGPDGKDLNPLKYIDKLQ